MSKKIIILVAIAALLLLPIVAYATTSSTYISLTQTGNKGGDMSYTAGTAYLSGNNNRGGSTNTLYIAAQMQGYYEVGGVIATYSCPAGQTLASHGVVLNQQYYHVLLDPSGPLASGCNGYGQLVK